MQAAPKEEGTSGAHVSLKRHQLIAQLGQGGMGEVWLAVVRGPAGVKKLQVVKQLKQSLANEPELTQMFLDEARLATRLNHPNIVQTNEVVEEAGRYFMAMEYLEGQSLHAILRKAGKGFPFGLHARCLCEVLAALDYACHLQDFDGTPLHIVHRDVSPHNVIVTYDGQSKLLDFGIAKAARRSTETGTGLLKGKLSYMSPEHALGQAVDGRSDVFAVGIMFFETAAGAPLWGRASDVEILRKLTNGMIPELLSVRPDAPEWQARICARALAFNPDERYQTAGEFLIDLERSLEANNIRSSSRELGAFVSEMFRADRTRMRSVIESQLKKLEASIPVDVAMLGSSGSLKTFEVVSGSGVHSGVESIARRESAGGPAKPASRRLAALFGVLAVVGLLALTMAVVLRNPRTPAAAPHTTVVEMTLRAAPQEATLYLDDAPLPSNPFRGSFPRDGASHRVRAQAAGFESKTQLVVFDSPRDVELALDPTPAPVAPTPTVAPPPATPRATVTPHPAPPKKAKPPSLDKSDPWN